MISLYLSIVNKNRAEAPLSRVNPRSVRTAPEQQQPREKRLRIYLRRFFY